MKCGCHNSTAGHQLELWLFLTCGVRNTKPKRFRGWVQGLSTCTKSKLRNAAPATYSPEPVAFAETPSTIIKEPQVRKGVFHCQPETAWGMGRRKVARSCVDKTRPSPASVSFMGLENQLFNRMHSQRVTSLVALETVRLKCSRHSINSCHGRHPALQRAACFVEATRKRQLCQN